MKKIIISPHIDDEVLGCGGIIDEDTLLVECGVDISRDVPGWGTVTRESRLDELRAISNFTGAKYICLNNKVNYYDLHDMIGDFESIIQEHKPLEIYIPHPSYNQDHRQVYEAAFTALRPHDVNFMVKRVLVYEQMHVFLWDDNDFKPNFFQKIDIERKIELYTTCIESQVRDFRNPEMVRSLAILRGKQSGHDFAEACQVLRWVNE